MFLDLLLANIIGLIGCSISKLQNKEWDKYAKDIHEERMNKIKQEQEDRRKRDKERREKYFKND